MTTARQLIDRICEGIVITIRVYEIEHEGDVDHAVQDITASGGVVRSVKSNFDDESAVFSIEVADKEDFMKKFRVTDSGIV